MPEGDTVWNTARALDHALAGRRLTGTDFRVPRLATTDLTGTAVRGCVSRGKHLLLRLELPTPAETDRGWTLHSHLRMDGSWRTYPPGARWTGGPAHLVRVVLRTAGVVAVGYHLHDVALVRTTDEDRFVAHLGPDPLGPDWDPVEAARRVATDPTRAIGAALLDQRNLAGLGTVYVAEVLFLSGLAPSTPVGAVPDLSRVVDLAHRLLTANRGRSTRVTTGDARRGRRLWVYGRRGQPCRRCATPIIQSTHPPSPSPSSPPPSPARPPHPLSRVSYHCPSCQPSPPPPPLGPSIMDFGQ